MAGSVRAVVIIPTFNERANLTALLPRIRSTTPGLDIVVVDDNSPDGTADFVREMRGRDPKIDVIVRTGERGYGPSVIAGFAWAMEHGYDRILQMDGDLSHDPQFLPAIFNASDVADVVLGSRYVTGGGTTGWSLTRRMLSRFGNFYARHLLEVRVADLTGGFRCWKREALECIEFQTIRSSGYSFMLETLFRASRCGLQIAEVPIVFPDRTEGHSKMSRRIVVEALIMVPRVRFTHFRARRASRRIAARSASGVPARTRG